MKTIKLDESAQLNEKSESGHWMVIVPGNYAETFAMTKTLPISIRALGLDEIARLAIVMDIELLKNKDYETVMIMTGLIETEGVYVGIVRAVDLSKAKFHLDNIADALISAIKAGGTRKVDPSVAVFKTRNTLVSDDVQYMEMCIGRLEKRDVN